MRVGFQPPVGVDVQAFSVHQEFLALGAFLDETSSSRDDAGGRVVDAVAEFEALQSALREGPLRDRGRGTAHDSPAARPVGHPVPEPAVPVVLVHRDADEADQRVGLDDGPGLVREQGGWDSNTVLRGRREYEFQDHKLRNLQDKIAQVVRRPEPVTCEKLPLQRDSMPLARAVYPYVCNPISNSPAPGTAGQ